MTNAAPWRVNYLVKRASGDTKLGHEFLGSNAGSMELAKRFLVSQTKPASWARISLIPSFPGPGPRSCLSPGLARYFGNLRLSRNPRLLSHGQLQHIPVLSSPVTHVVECGSKKKVGRIHARAVVAAVANKQPIGNRPADNRPSDAVGVVAFVELAVAGFAPGEAPVPACARIASIDTAPKPCNVLFIHETNPFVGHDRGRVRSARGLCVA